MTKNRFKIYEIYFYNLDSGLYHCYTIATSSIDKAYRAFKNLAGSSVKIDHIHVS